jgi:fatty acid desaturase
MENSPPTKPHAEYVREIKHLLPKEAFAPDARKLKALVIYFVVLICTYLLFRTGSALILYAALSLLAAHCLSCLGFLAHELSHDSIVKNGKLRYILEVISWGINLIPATVWTRVHNHTHHTQINTIKDPDRLYLKREKTTATNLYTHAFYPNHKFIKWNPVVAFHFIPYIFRNIVAAFYPKHSKPVLVPFKPKYSFQQKMKITAELLVILSFQFGIFYAVGADLLAYVFAGPVAYLLTSAILNTYIFTNHFLNPVREESDPLLGTTTVKVPAIFDKIHFNFSYHTEHHLFPSMNSSYFPLLSKILIEKYPDRYHYLQITDAWKKLWNNEDFFSEHGEDGRIASPDQKSQKASDGDQKPFKPSVNRNATRVDNSNPKNMRTRFLKPPTILIIPLLHITTFFT